MTAPNRIRLDQAEAAFAVANTPLFLVRKLRADPAVQEISKSINGATLLRKLRVAIKSKPRTLVDAVRPYVYLVALALRNDVVHLRRAASLQAPQFDWYEYIAKVLLDTHRTTTRKTIKYGELATPQLSAVSTAPTQRTIIRAGS